MTMNTLPLAERELRTNLPSAEAAKALLNCPPRDRRTLIDWHTAYATEAERIANQRMQALAVPDCMPHVPAREIAAGKAYVVLCATGNVDVQLVALERLPAEDVVRGTVRLFLRCAPAEDVWAYCALLYVWETEYVAAFKAGSGA